MTTSPAAREEAILLLATFPAYYRPNGAIDPQTNLSPFAYPPFFLSQAFKTLGLYFLPIPARAIEIAVIKSPDLQILLEEVPNC